MFSALDNNLAKKYQLSTTNHHHLNKIDILQINTQHKKTCTAILSHELISQSTHPFFIGLLQEPFIHTKTHLVPGLINSWKQYHNGENAKSAILVHESLNQFPIRKLFNDHIVVVIVQNIGFISIYHPQTDKEGRILDQLSLALDELKTQKIFRVVIGADTNGHTSLLSYSSSDARAKMWEDLVNSKDFFLINDPDAVTFRNSRNQTSSIDWTLCTRNMTEKIMSWKAHDDWDLLSDHQPISFCINDYSAVEKNTNKINNRQWKNADWPNMEKFLSPQINNLMEKEITSARDLDETVVELNTISQEAIETFVPLKSNRRRKNFWWNNSLQNLKTKLKKAKRKKDSNLQQIRREFEEQITKSKWRSWEKFLESSKNQTDQYLRYRILCKEKSDNTFEPLEKEDSSFTENKQESVELLLKTNFPDLDTNDNPVHLRIKDKVKHYFTNFKNPNEEIEVPVTPEEINDAIRSFSPRKKPGIDGIPASFYQQLKSSPSYPKKDF